MVASSDDWLSSVDNMRIRQSPQQLQKPIIELKEPSDHKLSPQPTKLQAIRDLGFDAFIDIDFPRNKPRFVTELVKNFD